MRDATAQTRFKSVSKLSNDLLLVRENKEPLKEILYVIERIVWVRMHPNRGGGLMLLMLMKTSTIVNVQDEAEIIECNDFNCYRLLLKLMLAQSKFSAWLENFNKNILSFSRLAGEVTTATTKVTTARGSYYYNCLEEFKEPEVHEYGPRDSSSKPTTGYDKESDNSKENTDDSLEQHQMTDTETSSFESPLKVSKVDKEWKEKVFPNMPNILKTVIPTAAKIEKQVRKPVRYAEMYMSQRPRGNQRN
ncbi:hypothetical protein Tco_1056879 [Tanacetum coccineum]|uniref:Uncharacterized protein n=1 Tax=Tanacetum coccineum TaxID=301880 RepID=A0ABQ5H5P7_9ASTR